MFYMTLVTGDVWVIDNPFSGPPVSAQDTLRKLQRSIPVVTVQSREGFNTGFAIDGTVFEPLNDRVAINPAHIVALQTVEF